MAKTIDARVSLVADSDSYNRGVRSAIAATDRFNKSTKRVRQSPFKGVTRSVVGLAGAYIGTQGLINVVRRSVEEQQESIKVGRQTNAVLKSTKGAAGLTAKSVGDLAQALSEKTAVDDEAIQSAENLLLTFTKIGKTTFPAATKAVLDLSAATGTSLKGASIQVGKALQDPIKGITALRRVGVNFSTDQQDVIKKLVDTGKTAEAQKLILKELAIEFGGSAAAQATPLDKLRVTYQNLLETLGGYLVPILNRAAVALMSFVAGVRAGTGPGGVLRDNIKGITIALAGLVAVLAAGKIAGSLAGIGGLMAVVFSNPVTASIAAVALGIAAVGGAFALAYTRSKSLQALVAQIGATVAPIFKSVGDAAKRELPGALAAAGRVARSMTRLFVALKPIIVPIFKAIAFAVSTSLRTIGPVLKFVAGRIDSMTSAARTLLSISRSVFKGVASAVKTMRDVVVSAFSVAKLGVDALVNAIARVGRAVSNLPGGAALKKLAQAVGARSTVSAGVKNAKGFGLSGEVGDAEALTAARRNVSQAKTKKGRDSASRKLRVLEASQAAKESRKTATQTLNGFFEGVRDQIRNTRLDSLMKGVNEARSLRAGLETKAARGGLQSSISRAQSEAADPKVQAKFARETLRLDARIAQARKSGSLEAVDALQSEKDALDARYGPAYLTGLQDQLAQLNENEIEASSEAAASAFAAQFTTGMQSALDGLLGNGTVAKFFQNLTSALAGSGVAPGDLPASITAGAGQAATSLVIPKKSKPKRKPKSKRASGGMLTPGMLTLVGETGPELIMGGKVNSSTRTNRIGQAGGMNITVNAYGAAGNDPALLARELGWQLSTR